MNLQKVVNWIIIVLLVLSVSGCSVISPTKTNRKIPVILDSDIGGDIDDTWALGFLVKSPEFDIKLAVGDHGLPQYRAKLFCKTLERFGRSDIPVGIGINTGVESARSQEEWIGDYDLSSYPGKIYEDGVQTMIDMIMNSKETITVIAVGPLPNIAEALRREPRIAQKAKIVGMYGSVRKGYRGSDKIGVEWNVKQDIKSCQKVFSSDLDMTITPVDTCSLVQLKGDKYQKIFNSDDPVAKTIIEQYRIWSNKWDVPNFESQSSILYDTVAKTIIEQYHVWSSKWNVPNFESQSSILYDTVAIYLAMDQKFTKIETLGIRVDDEGYTRIDPTANKIKVATDWNDMDAFEDLLVSRLTN